VPVPVIVIVPAQEPIRESAAAFAAGRPPSMDLRAATMPDIVVPVFDAVHVGQAQIRGRRSPGAVTSGRAADQQDWLLPDGNVDAAAIGERSYLLARGEAAVSVQQDAAALPGEPLRDGGRSPRPHRAAGSIPLLLISVSVYGLFRTSSNC
jgi:hypothetical protein